MVAILRRIITFGKWMFPLLSFSTLAQLEPQQLAPKVDLGTIQPLYELIRPLIVKASLLVGGIFGIYIILLAFRVYYERRNQILLEHIRYDFDQLNKHQGIPSSQERKSFFHKAIIDKIFPTHAQRKHPLAKPKRP